MSWLTNRENTRIGMHRHQRRGNRSDAVSVIAPLVAGGYRNGVRSRHMETMFLAS